MKNPRRLGLLAAFLLLGLPSWPVQAQSADRPFEAGVQFGALDLNNSIGEKPLAAGGRFGYWRAEWGTIEAEYNYFPENPSGNFGETLVLAGVKAGGWFEGIGVFAKARPGVIHFGGDFFKARNPGNRSQPALDVGLVVQRMFGERAGVRLDVGDTMIFFGDAVIDTGDGSPDSPGTAHSVQMTLGFFVRF